MLSSLLVKEQLQHPWSCDSESLPGEEGYAQELRLETPSWQASWCCEVEMSELLGRES